MVINLGYISPPAEDEEEETNVGDPAVSEEDELFLVLEGSRQTHLVTMKHAQNLVWEAPIPGKQ